MTDEAAFTRFVERESAGLLRTAWLLTGSWSGAEDIVQSALLTVWTHWSSIRDVSAADAYARRVLATTYLKSARRRWHTEIVMSEPPDQREQTDDVGRLALRSGLIQALSDVPARQRTALVLRYFLDLSERQTADAMSCSIGAVKSYTSKGISRLRQSRSLTAFASQGESDERR